MFAWIVTLESDDFVAVLAVFDNEAAALQFAEREAERQADTGHVYCRKYDLLSSGEEQCYFEDGYTPSRKWCDCTTCKEIVDLNPERYEDIQPPQEWIIERD